MCSAPLPPPKNMDMLPRGVVLKAGRGVSTIMPDIDFETYSEAGYVYDNDKKKWVPVQSNKKGIGIVGLVNYAAHSSTEVLCMAYNLKDGTGPKLWTPRQAPPQDLFDYIAAGGLVEAWNVSFEREIWKHVCVGKYGWPAVPDSQWRCAMAKSQAFCLPGGLAKAGEAMAIEEAKDEGGKTLLQKLSTPVTKHTMASCPDLALKLYMYCQQDIRAEAEIAARVPDLSEFEQAVWALDQECNSDGIHVDVEAIEAATKVLDQCYDYANSLLQTYTNGEVETIFQNEKILNFLKQHYDINSPNLDEGQVDYLVGTDKIKQNLIALNILKLKQYYGKASVKKYYNLLHQHHQGVVNYLFIYHGARTGRDTGAAVQPQNLPSSGPDVTWCAECDRPYIPYGEPFCPRCHSELGLSRVEEWSPEACGKALSDLKECGTQEFFRYWPDVVDTLSACLRGVFVPTPGYDFIGSDFSAIEAVVAAQLTQEKWRLDVFNNRDDIYLASIARIKNVPLEFYKNYQKEHGKKHPDRKIGKVAELASGFGGWINSWKQFGADRFFDSDDEIKQSVLAWRQASPAIVEAWGGQVRGKPWDGTPELYGLEGNAVLAIMNPGREFRVDPLNVTYVSDGSRLYCILPSGRYITYHEPSLGVSTKWPDQKQIFFKGYNTNPNYGKVGWVDMSTYGGRLFENVVQSVARDLMWNAALNLRAAGYRIVIRLHDELCSQVPEGTGSIEEFERVGSLRPAWAADWPVFMEGGWRDKRFRK